MSLSVCASAVHLAGADDVSFEFGVSDSFDEALAAAAVVAALHPIVSLEIWCKFIESGISDKIFSYLPSAAYARHVSSYCISETLLTAAQLEAFIARFPWLKSVDLDRIPVDFNWTILHSKLLLRLPAVEFSPTTDAVAKVQITEVAQEEIIRYCRDFSELRPGQPKLLSLWGGWQFSQAFVDRVSQVR
ncbi:hypothetical protein AAVH_30264 [Aphelenchoides avenae]|nr:hypothetical protein AAVH_30264 [Aphelenchus avenae]